MWPQLALAAFSAYSAYRSSRDSGDRSGDSNAFNADQAALQRDWEERMFRSRHQFEVEDLRKAGLNPILSAGGQPPVPSGQSASAVQPDYSRQDRRTRSLELAVNSARAASELGLNKALTDKASGEARSARANASTDELISNFYQTPAGRKILALKQVVGSLGGALGGFAGGLVGSAARVSSARGLARRRF